MLDRMLVAYSYLPHHPGKWHVYNRMLPRVQTTWITPRLRTRFGVRFECDLRDKVPREIYYLGYDRRDCRALRPLVKPGSVILDVGANVGYYSLQLASWMSGKGTVHSFEPFPSTAQQFERNLGLNPRFQNMIFLHRLAMSNFTGSLGMNVLNEDNSGCNSLSADGCKKVEVITLDAFAQQEKFIRIDLIKIDIEGAEVDFLQGAEQTIARFRPVLVIEVNPSTLQRFGKTAADVIKLLGQYRYQMNYADRFGGLKPMKRLPVFGEEPNIFAFPID